MTLADILGGGGGGAIPKYQLCKLYFGLVLGNVRTVVYSTTVLLGSFEQAIKANGQPEGAHARTRIEEDRVAGQLLQDPFMFRAATDQALLYCPVFRIGSAFNLSLDPGSGSVFGIRIRILDPDV
jgi:hypothetical protein